MMACIDHQSAPAAEPEQPSISVPSSMPDPPVAAQWAAALAEWAIPDEILRRAPESPWGFPPELFRASDRVALAVADDPSRRRARESLGSGGTVLDVGCGGGAAGLALVPPAGRVVGVDPSPAMLASFAGAAQALGVDHSEVEGSWPAVAERVAPADIVVCHHVVYNVAAIEPFVAALGSHARRRVVVELPDRHPSSALRPLWTRFWGLDRPDEPSADLFAQVVGEAGFRPRVERQDRRVAKVGGDAAYVAFVRRRLCLDATRDGEVAAALAAMDGDPSVTTVTVWWDVSSVETAVSSRA
jgi:SAM-dependent methyltransferase